LYVIKQAMTGGTRNYDGFIQAYWRQYISNLHKRIMFKLDLRGKIQRQKLSREAEEGDTVPQV